MYDEVAYCQIERDADADNDECIENTLT